MKHIPKKLSSLFPILLCLAGASLTGCSTCSPHATPAGPAQAGAASTDWEYKVLRMNAYPKEMEQTLNQLASDHWAVQSISLVEQHGDPGQHLIPEATIVLKRPRK